MATSTSHGFSVPFFFVSLVLVAVFFISSP